MFDLRIGRSYLIASHQPRTLLNHRPTHPALEIVDLPQYAFQLRAILCRKNFVALLL